jgi:hypothetical protein
LAPGVLGAPQNKPAPAPVGPLLERVVSVDREVDAAAGMILRLTTGPHGGVQVASWRERKIRVEARVEINAPTEQDLDTLATAVNVTVDPSPVSVTVSTLGPHDPRVLKALKKFPEALTTMPWRVDYVVWVPQYTGVDLTVTDGDTRVEGVAGQVQVTCTHGALSLVNVAGTVVATAGDGDVDVTTHERSWRSGTLNVVASHGSISFSAPHGFNASLDATSPGGIALAGETAEDLGTESKKNLGAGGAEVTLAAAGKIVLTIGTPPEQ